MKKLLLLSYCVILSFTYSQAQIIVFVKEPPSVAGGYGFTWADPAGGWGTNDLNIPANAIEDTLLLVDDGTADDSLGCNPLVNDLTGKIAVVYRGTCEFGTKGLNAQNAGAVGLIIINHSGAPVGMAPGADGAQDTIPIVMISTDDGAALRAELDAGNDVIAFIGNKVGLFNNDLGMFALDVLAPRATANPALISISATEFNVPIAAWIHNYGINNQTGVTLTVDITGAGNYSATSLPVSIISGDSAYVTIPTYSASSYSGLYHVNYIINSDSTDEFDSDNAFYANFFIDSLVSYTFIDSVTEMPVSSAHFRPSSNPAIFETCIHFRDPNASRLSAMGLYASGSGGAGTPATMAGEYLEARIYEWNDVFTGLSDPGFPASPWTLNEVGFGSYTYAADLQREMVYIPFTANLVLVDNQRYLFCARTYSPDVYMGFDSYYDYDEVINYYDQPVSIVLSDADQFAIGFGTDITSSVTVLFGTGNTQFTTSISDTSEPFCNPACDGWATVSAFFGTPPYTYLWNDPLTQTTATATGLCNGTYMVIVNDNAGAVDTLTVTLNPPGTPPSFTLSATDNIICNGDSTWITASTVSQGVYVWSTGDSTQTIGVDSVGTYIVTVTNCGGSTVDSITINLPNLPVASISGNIAFCPGDSLMLTAGTEPSATYSWSTGETTQSIYIDTVGVYAVIVTNCAGADTADVTTSFELAPTVFVSVTGPTTFCHGMNSANLTASGGTSYLWSNGSALQTINLTDSTDSGDYWVISYNACGDSVISDTTTLVIYPLPFINTGAIAIDSSRCISPFTGAITGITASGTPLLTYQWDDPALQTTTDATGLSAGAYTLTVTDTNGCENTSGPHTVPNFSLPPTPTISNIGGTLTSSSATGNQWLIDGSIMSAELDQTFVPTQTGSHVYTVTVTDPVTGCTSLESAGETVVISGINEISSGLLFNIYPNPNKGQFVIEFSNVKIEDYLIEVRNIIGQLIYTEEFDKVSGELLKIDLSQHHGVYFLSISNSFGTRTEKLIIY